jgi:bacteriorhodopsin
MTHFNICHSTYTNISTVYEKKFINWLIHTPPVLFIINKSENI